MDGEPVTLATVPAVRGCRPLISWGLGNELHFIDLNGSTKQDSTASVVQWGQLSAGQRRVAYDSLSQYQQLHQAALDPLSPEGWAQAHCYSRTVSAILAADGIRGSEATGEELAALQERALWDLLSLFFLEAAGASAGAGAGGPVAQDLARWLRTNAVAVSGGVAAQPLPPALLASLREAALPEAAEAYWPTVARLAALGWIDDAVELLGLHSAWLRYDCGGGGGGGGSGDEGARAVVKALDATTLLLRRFPVLAQPGVVHSVGKELGSAPELLAYRRSWQAQCGALLADPGLWAAAEAADNASAEGLRALLGVLVGDEGMLEAATVSWLELLVAQLLHAYPTATRQVELCQLLRGCFEAGDGASAPEFLQVAAAVLEACCELDAQAAMRVCSAFCSDWFMAHAPDLMAAHPAGAGVLARELPHLGGSQVEFYLLEYAAALMPHATTWPLAAAYLAWCPAHGQAALEALLHGLPQEAGEAWAAHKGAELARYHRLTRAAEGVARAQGVLCWQAGLVGAALSWFAQCNDVRRIDVALQPLADAVSKGQLSRDDSTALEALQPLLEVLPAGSSNAALLAVHRLLKQNNTTPTDSGSGGMHAAVAALAQLPEAMRDGCVQLVCATVPLLPPGTLSERDALYLLQWLLNAEGRPHFSRQQQAAGASMQVARLALIRSLAASHMQLPSAVEPSGQQALLSA